MNTKKPPAREESLCNKTCKTIRASLVVFCINSNDDSHTLGEASW